MDTVPEQEKKPDNHPQTAPGEEDVGKAYMRHAVGKILSATSALPQGGPQSSNVEYGAAVAFNATALNFLTNMLRIFPGDIMILKCIQELRGCMNNTSRKSGVVANAAKTPGGAVNMPALLFARQIDATMDTVDGTTKTIYDLIMDKDEQLFIAKTDVQLLDMLDLKTKYGALNEQNRAYVWSTLNKLVMSASMVVMVEHDHMDAVDDLIATVVKKGKHIAKSSGGRMDIRGASQLIASDKEVRRASKRVMESAAAGSTDQRLSCETVGEFIAQTTGKTVNVAGLADKDGMIDMSDGGMDRIMKILSSQGHNCVKQQTAREAAVKEGLKKKLEQRRSNGDQ